MATVPPPPAPGSMTVPPLFGWEQILTACALVVVVALAALVVLASGRATSGRSEWQAWLDARSSRRRDAVTDPTTAPHDRPAERVGPGADG